MGFVVFMVHLATISITRTGIDAPGSLGAAVIYNNKHVWHEHLQIGVNGDNQASSIGYDISVKFAGAVGEGGVIVNFYGILSACYDTGDFGVEGEEVEKVGILLVAMLLQ
ncbi:hypothetical protein Dimus_023802 [Dionaea muscipula]